jgi:signal transduction histidine kinase
LCGAAKALQLTGTTRRPAQEYCQLVLAPERGHAAVDFRVWTTPVDVEEEPFTVFAIKDSTDEQRRGVLERMFFHDVLNSAGSLQQLLELLPVMPAHQAARLTETASHLARQVVEEIQAQRDLAAAERGELRPLMDNVDVRDVLDEMVEVYRHHSAAREKHIVLEAGAAPPAVRTDPTLLRRVLGNLLKNALEASRQDDVVTVRCRVDGGTLFEVHNPSVMPEAVRLQVFRRSFSTKQGIGRGVGAYSARLLTERYLGGQLWFRSEEGDGTTFLVKLP